MFSVEEARDRILSRFAALPGVAVPLLEALGLTLDEEVVAGADIPPFHNSAMDGYAVRSHDVAGASKDAPSELRVLADLGAGYTTDVVVTTGTAIRIMTGAPLPEGADAVVQFEWTDEGERSAPAPEGRAKTPSVVRVYQPVSAMQNVRPAGEDVHRGELVLRPGAVIRPGEIGVLASLGHKSVKVVRRPRVAVLATGDELVEVGEQPGPGKIVNSNSYSVAALVSRYGGLPTLLGIARDRYEDLRERLQAGLAADLIITTGGVSVGDFDYVKTVLRVEGQVDFWQVRMKPGKPLAFGSVGGVPLLGLPGNPVSAMVTFEQFARPAILKMLGRADLAKPTVEAVLLDDVANRGQRRHFTRVIVERRGDGFYARSTGEQGSGILTSMARANGLLIIPEDVRLARAGERFSVQMLDWD